MRWYILSIANWIERLKNKYFFEHLGTSGQDNKKTVFLCIALLFIYSIAIYSKSLQNDFIWDSTGVILEDPLITDLANIPAFFMNPLVLGTTGDVGDGLTVNAIKYYRPLLSTLHTIEYALFGKSPVGYKAVNLLFNALVVVLGFIVVKQVTRSLPIAFLASLVYASVLARAEAVYWIYSDSHILSALFSLAAFWAYLGGRRWLALLLMMTGLLFQESGVFFPLLLIAYEGTRSSEQTLYRRLAKTIPFGLLSGFYLIARHFVVGEVPSSALDYWSLAKAAGYQAWEHARIFLFPDGPATAYLYQAGMFSPGGGASTLGMFALLFFGTTGFLLYRFRKEDCFWYFWFLALIVVSFNIGAYGDYLMAEKTLYLAALGLSVLMVKFLLSVKRFQPTGLMIICAVFLFNSVQIYGRADSWVDTTTYLDKVLEFEPEFDLALIQSGNNALTEGRFEAANHHYLKVLRLRPELAPSIGKSYVDSILRQAEILATNGENERAIQIMTEAVTVINNSSELYNGLGIVHYYSGKQQEAKKYWMLALQFDPNNNEALNNLELLGDTR